MWPKRKKNPELPTTPQDYPAGICVVSETGRYFLNNDGKRYRIVSDSIFHSWRFPVVVRTTDAALVKYPVAVTKLAFRDGTLLNNIADGRLYLVSGRKLRHITSPEVLTRLGLTTLDALTVSDSEIKLMKLGESIQ